MTPFRRSPRSLSYALDGLREDLAPQTLLAEVQRVWVEAVGVSIANQARPVSERGGALTVSCSASVWAQELHLMAPTIIEQLNQVLTAGRISRLRCVSMPLIEP